MAISSEEVKHIADLAKLELTEEEASKYSGLLTAILDYAEMLDEVDTEGIIPTNQVTGLTNVFREDEIHDYPADQRAKLFREVPKMKDGFVVVPHAINKFK